MSILNRRVGTLIVLAVVGYSSVTTALNLFALVQGKVSYAAPISFLSLVSVLAGFWLIYELVRRHARQIHAAWTLFAAMAFIQLYAVIGFIPPASEEVSPEQQKLVIYIFTAVMILLYALVPAYVTWRKKRYDP